VLLSPDGCFFSSTAAMSTIMSAAQKTQSIKNYTTTHVLFWHCFCFLSFWQKI
jgi:hypothetical protein